MKKLVLLFLISIFSISFSFAASTDVAIVNSVVGKVEVQVNESWIQVKNGDILSSGSVISTGFKSSAVLYIGDSLIEVRALTRLTIEEIVEQNQNYNTTMFLDAGSIKADIKKSENKRVGFKVRTSVATASVRGTSGEIYSDGTLVCLSGKWAITPPEPKGSKLHKRGPKPKDSDKEQKTENDQTTETEQEIEEVVMEESTESETVAEVEETTAEPVAEMEQTTENADQDFYDAVDAGAFIVTQDQTITINSAGAIVPPHEVAHTQSVQTGGIQSEEILENNSDLRISSPTKPSDTSAISKNKATTIIDVSISIE
ncbi:MAG: FecR domain-containing protein [Spirochaetaceae bacterium]|nr:FecR domain-containing protein [Spirochaetaceae bacterium]